MSMSEHRNGGYQLVYGSGRLLWVSHIQGRIVENKHVRLGFI
jgi:hypothetical protein